MRLQHGVFQLEIWIFRKKDFDGGFIKALGGHAWIKVIIRVGKNGKEFMRNGWWIWSCWRETTAMVKQVGVRWVTV